MKTKLLLLLLCLVSGIYWGTRLAGPSQEQVEEDSPPNPKTEELDAGAPQAIAADTPEPLGGLAEIPEPLNEEIRAGTMSVALHRLRIALENESAEQIEAASDFLFRLLGEDPRNVRDALAAFAAESDPALLTILARLMAPHLSPEDPELLNAALDLLQQDHPSGKRAAALAMFSALTPPPAEVMETVLRLSREDESNQVRLNAILAIGQWSANSPHLWDRLSEELVHTIDASTNEKVRGNAIQLIALHSGVHRPQVLAAMDEYMKHDPSPQNRAIAAMTFGGVTGKLRRQATELLEAALVRESHIDTRRNILTQIARAAGEDAIEVLQRLPAEDPLLEQDIQDYLNIIGSKDDLTFEEVFYLKFALDAERDTIVGSFEHRD